MSALAARALRPQRGNKGGTAGCVDRNPSLRVGTGFSLSGSDVVSMKPVTTRPNFVELEKTTLAWWRERSMIERYIHKNDDSDRRWSFIDGPITANNPMGVHHAWGRTYKDVFQ